MICKHCFRMSDDGLEYCPYCGHSFTDDTVKEVENDTEKENENRTDDGRDVPPRNDQYRDPYGDGPAYRRDSVPQGDRGYGGRDDERDDRDDDRYNGGYNGGGYDDRRTPPPYQQYPPLYMIRPEKTPLQKLLAGIGHAILYILLFVFCQTIVATVYMVPKASQAYSELYEKYESMYQSGAITEEQLQHQLEEEMNNMAVGEDAYVSALDMNIISIISALLTIIVLVIISSVKHRPFYDHVGIYPVRTPKLLLMIPLGIAVQFLTNEVLYFIPWPEWVIEQHNSAFSFLGQSSGPIEFAVEILSAVVIAPIVEEMIFRGCVYTRLRRGMPTAAAILASAFAFGWVHGTIVALLYATVLGALLAYVYVKFESLLAPILLHMSFNLANYVPILREDSSSVENVIVFAVSAAVLVVCFAVVLLSDVGRKNGAGKGGYVIPPER